MDIYKYADSLETPKIMNDGTPYDANTVLLVIDSKMYPAFDNAIQQAYGKSLDDIARTTEPKLAMEAVGVGFPAMLHLNDTEEIVTMKGDSTISISREQDSDTAIEASFSNRMTHLTKKLLKDLEEDPQRNKIVIVNRPGRLAKMLGKKTVATTIATFQAYKAE